MEIQTPISSNITSFTRGFPLNGYFKFRHEMMTILEIANKTSEHITKLWN